MKVMKTLLAGSFIAAAAPAFAAETPSTLTDAQRDEVRALVKEVLADADSRATLAGGATAGIDENGKVFLRSEDDKFGMNIGGTLQFRYIYHNKDGSPSGSSDEGFDMRRMNLDIQGHLGGDQRVNYRVLLGCGPAADPSLTGSQVGVEEAYADYVVAEGWSVRGGKFMLPYTRESLVLANAQVAVERSTANEFFSLNRAEGVQVEYRTDVLRVRGAVSDGGNSETTSTFVDSSNFAACGRAELLIAGSDKTGMDAFNDNFAMRDGSGKQGLLVGGAAYFEDPQNSTAFAATFPGAEVENEYGATVDATFKVANLAFYGAGFVSHDTLNGNHGYNSPTPWGAVGQVDVGVTPNVDVFGQYNFIDNTRVGSALGTGKEVVFQSAVVGANYHVNSRVKLTGDVVYVIAGNTALTPLTPGAATGAGTGAGYGLGNGVKGETAVRLQLQVNF